MTKKQSLIIKISVIAIIVIRFLLTAFVPLLDKTESRYAEIARLMTETKEWVVLQIDYGVPFWAKPPLSTWLSAISFEMLGINELAARLPSFLLALAIIFLVARLAKTSGFSFYIPAFILLTMPEFLIHTGVVSTDSALGFSIVIIMLSFWKSINNDQRNIWNYMFFIGIGLGLLAKGPIAVVLSAPPIFIWCLLKKGRFKDLFTKLPWLVGIIITFAIALPWYFMAEQRSPGFLDYFIVGEHFKRFVVPDWSGDLYGSGHSQPLGMIWLFLLLFAFPWVEIVLYKIWVNRKTIWKNKRVSYLVLWMLWVPLFFTVSKNILHTYIVPVLVPIALLMLYWWKDFKLKRTALFSALIFPVAAVVFFVALLTGKLENYANSDKYLLETTLKIDPKSNIPIYYFKRKSYSGQFYTKGKAILVNSEKELDSVCKMNDKLFLIALKKRGFQIPQSLEGHTKILDSNYKTQLYLFDKNQSFRPTK